MLQRERPSPVPLLIYTLFLLLVYVLCTAAGMPLSVDRFRLELLVCVPAAVALMEGPALGAVLGLFTGVCYDMAFTGVEGLYPLYFMAFGILAGLFAARFLRRIFPSMLLLTTFAVLGLDLFRLAGLLIFGARVDVLLYAQQVCGRALVTAAFSPLVYCPVKKLAIRFGQTR